MPIIKPKKNRITSSHFELHKRPHNIQKNTLPGAKQTNIKEATANQQALIPKFGVDYRSSTN